MKYTFTILIDSVSYEVFPVNSQTLTESLVDDDTGAYFYRKKLDGIRLRNDGQQKDFTLIKGFIEASGCDEATLMVYASCSTDPIYEGYFSKFDINMDEDKSICEIKPNINDVYRCIYEGWEKRLNIQKITTDISVIYRSNYYLDYYWDTSPTPPEYTEIDSFLVGGVTTYGGVREIITLDCDGLTVPSPPDLSWTLLGNFCSTTGFVTYERPVSDVSGFSITFGDQPDNSLIIGVIILEDFYVSHSVWELDELVFYSHTFFNGKRLDDILEFLLDDCSYSIKSDFFQFNPDTVTDINYVTGLDSKVKDLVFFDASDISIPSPDTNASKTYLNLQDLLKELYHRFKVKWFIEGTNTLRLEHESYFNTTVGLDISELKGFKSYSLEESKAAQRTTFSNILANNIDHIGEAIEFSGSCTTKQTKAINSISTSDVIALSDSDLREGFCIMHTTIDGDTGNHLIDSDTGRITSTELSNGHLSWSVLHYYYHRHNLEIDEVTMNNVLESALSVKRIRSQKLRTLNTCFSIDPFLDVLTSLGQGTVIEVKTSLTSRYSDIDLLV